MTTRVSNTRNPVAGPLPGMPIPDNWPEGRGAITRSEETSGTRSKHRCNPQRVGRDAFTKPRNCAGMNWSHPQGVNGKREYSYGREHRENKLGRQAQQRKHNKRQPRPMPRPRLQLLARENTCSKDILRTVFVAQGLGFYQKISADGQCLGLVLDPHGRLGARRSLPRPEGLRTTLRTWQRLARWSLFTLA